MKIIQSVRLFAMVGSTIRLGLQPARVGATMLHIIQNDPEVPPGNILEFLTIPYEIHHPYSGGGLPEIGGISALIVLGGAMGANDDHRYPFLIELKNLIRLALSVRIPYLGICLGGQLLAAALGVKVVSGRWEEKGALPVRLTSMGCGDLLFKGVDAEFHTFQWHHDSFDIPASGVHLATSTDCPHQAFRVGETAWGLQFHPEVSEQIIRDWSAWESSTLSRSEELVEQFGSISAGYEVTARQIVQNFIRIAGLASDATSP